MKRFLLILFMGAVLAGCGTPPVVYKDRIVEVPVIVEAPAPDLPHVAPIGPLPVDFLVRDSTHPEVARAYVISLEKLENKNKQYREAFDAVNEN